MKTRILYFFSSVLLALSFSSQASVLAQNPKPKNFHEVEVGIYRSARPEDTQMDFIAAKQPVAQARTLLIVDLQGGDPDLFQYFEPGESPDWILHEEQMALQKGLSFASLPMSSTSEVSSDEAANIQQVLVWMDQALQNPTQHQVLIHCEHGVDRTGLVIALFRVQYQHWNPEKAFREWQSYGHQGWENYLVTHNLDKYFFQVTGWQPSSASWIRNKSI